MRRSVYVALWVLLIVLILLAWPMAVAAQAPSAADLERQGDELRAARSYADALLQYRAALRQNERSPVLWNKIGMAELQLGQVHDAEKSFARAVKLDGKLSRARNNLGATKFMRHDYKGAIKEYSRALQLEPGNASYHSNLAAALFERHETERAIAEYTRAYQLDPTIFERTSRFGTVAQLSSPADRAAYLYMVAKLYAKAGNSDGALEYLRKAIEEGYPNIRDVYTDAEFSQLRSAPRLQELISRPPANVPQ